MKVLFDGVAMADEEGRALWKRFSDWMEEHKGDLAGYMDGYAKSDDLVFTSGGNVRRGWQVTHDHYQKKYGQDKSGMGHLKFEVLGVQSLGADGAVVLGNWILTNSPSDGRGVFSVVLERRPEGWRVIHDHTSLSSAP